MILYNHFKGFSCICPAPAFHPLCCRRQRKSCWLHTILMIRSAKVATGHRDNWGQQPCTLTLTPRIISETPLNPTCMFLMVGGNRSIQREPTQTQGEHADSTQEAGIRTNTLWGDGDEPQHLHTVKCKKLSYCVIYLQFSLQTCEGFVINIVERQQQLISSSSV